MNESFVLAHLHEDFFTLAETFPSQFPGWIRILQSVPKENVFSETGARSTPLGDVKCSGAEELGLPPSLYFQVVHVANVGQNRETQSHMMIGGSVGSLSRNGDGGEEMDQERSAVDATLQECEEVNATWHGVGNGGGRSYNGAQKPQQRCLKLLLTDGRDLLWAVERSSPLFPSSSSLPTGRHPGLFPSGVPIGGKIRVDLACGDPLARLLHRGVLRLEGRYTTLLGGGVAGLQSYWETEAREYLRRRSGRPAGLEEAPSPPTSIFTVAREPGAEEVLTAGGPIPQGSAPLPSAHTTDPPPSSSSPSSSSFLAAPTPHSPAPVPLSPPESSSVVDTSTSLTAWMLEVWEALIPVSGLPPHTATHRMAQGSRAVPPARCRVRAVVTDVLSDLHFTAESPVRDARGTESSTSALSYALMVRLGDAEGLSEAAMAARQHSSYTSSSSYADSALSVIDEDGFSSDPAFDGWNFMSGSLPVYLGDAMLQRFIGFPASLFAGVSQFLDDITAFLGMRSVTHSQPARERGRSRENTSREATPGAESEKAEQLMEKQALLFSLYPDALTPLHVPLPHQVAASPSLRALHEYYHRQAEPLQKWMENAVSRLGKSLEELGEKYFTLQYAVVGATGQTSFPLEESGQNHGDIWSFIRQHPDRARDGKVYVVSMSSPP